MRTNVMDSGHKVFGRTFHELAALDLEWDGYLPAVHPISLLVITVVRIDCPMEPDPWIRADVCQGKLTNVGHADANDVAVFKRSLKEIDELDTALHP